MTPANASRWRAGARAGWWAAALSILTGAASAASPPRILVEGQSGDPVVERLLSELTSSGFIVTTSETTSTGAPTPSDDRDAVARVVSNAFIEIWCIDHTAKTATELEVLSVAASDDSHRAVAAIRAAEIVRAHLLPVPVPGAPIDSSVAPRAPRAAPEPESPRPPPPAVPPASPSPVSPAATSSFDGAHFGLDAGPLILVGGGGVAPSTALVVMPRWMPIQPLIVRASFTVPLASPDVVASAGRASMTEWLLGASVDWNLLPSELDWQWLLGAGTAASRIQTQGVATPPYVSSSGNAWTWVPFIEASLTRRLWSPQIRLGILALLGAAWPEVQIRFAGQDVASWGRPVAGTAFTFQVEAL